jgi:CRISPR system Cascade subunit CasE
MHAAVLSSFPQPDEVRGRVLWRVDTNGSQDWLYVVSGPQPDFAHIVEQAGWPTTQEGWTTRSYEPLLERLAEGQTWAFRLTANPVRTSRATKIVDGLPRAQPDDAEVKPKRYAHVTVAQQIRWLAERCQRWGFTIPEAEDTGDARGPEGNIVVHSRRTDRFQRQGNTVTISKASFDGLLEVTNVDSLRKTLIDGAGPAKAYGCGLLTLAPVT